MSEQLITGKTAAKVARRIVNDYYAQYNCRFEIDPQLLPYRVREIFNRCFGIHESHESSGPEFAELRREIRKAVAEDAGSTLEAYNKINGIYL